MYFVIDQSSCDDRNSHFDQALVKQMMFREATGPIWMSGNIERIGRRVQVAETKFS